jgi:hypothetical protein
MAVLPLFLVSIVITADVFDFGARSCPELVSLRAEKQAAATRLAEWMEHHCPGEMESTEPFCRMQSGQLMERLVALGEVKSALHAKRCEVP